MAENAEEDRARTMAMADVALGQIRALRQSAHPRNFEVWYTYAAGYNSALNQAINEKLQRGEALSDTDTDQIYERFLSPIRLTEGIDQVGTRVMDEIAQVMAMVDAAAGSASSYTESLESVTQQLGSAKDSAGLRNIVETLVKTAKEMEESNARLEARLSASKLEINQLQENLESVRHESLTDPLTTLANRKFFDTTLEEGIANAHATGAPFSLLMTDIDHFKQFNDRFGHLTGDQVLRLVATAVKQNVKGQDFAARYGGEEFAIVLPETPLRAALTVGDHIRRAVMTKELRKRSTGENLGRITISVGVATLQPGDTSQSLIGRADVCLYAAKRNGRNRVVCETDPEVAPAARSA